MAIPIKIFAVFMTGLDGILMPSFADNSSGVATKGFRGGFYI